MREKFLPQRLVKPAVGRHEAVDDRRLQHGTHGFVVRHLIEDAAKLLLFLGREVLPHDDGAGRSDGKLVDDAHLRGELRIRLLDMLIDLVVDARSIGEVVGDRPDRLVVVVRVEDAPEILLGRQPFFEQAVIDGEPARMTERIDEGEDASFERGEVLDFAVGGDDDEGAVEDRALRFDHGEKLDRLVAAVCRISARREEGDVGFARRDELIKLRRAALLHHGDGASELLGEVGGHALIGAARLLGTHDRREGDDERALCSRCGRRGRMTRKVDEAFLVAAACKKEREGDEDQQDSLLGHTVTSLRMFASSAGFA